MLRYSTYENNEDVPKLLRHILITYYCCSVNITNILHRQICKWDGAMQVVQTDYEMGWRLASQRGHIYKWDGAMQVI